MRKREVQEGRERAKTYGDGGKRNGGERTKVKRSIEDEIKVEDEREL